MPLNSLLYAIPKYHEYSYLKITNKRKDTSLYCFVGLYIYTNNVFVGLCVCTNPGLVIYSVQKMFSHYVNTCHHHV